ncbi:MAG: NAD(P)H-hydrate dehydratase [Candidatus Sedimenticola endophacoides]
MSGSMVTETTALPQALYRAADVRELDRMAIEEQGIPCRVLMERAGAAAFAWMRRIWPSRRSLLVVCGGGNNGGDGYVVARLARQAGLDCRVMQVGDPSRLRGDALACAGAFAEAGGRAEPFAGIPDRVELIVDALFGTGLERPVAGEWAVAVEAVNDHPAPVFSLDLPSGLHSDSGRVLGVAVRAAASISFIGLKRGMFTGQGPAYCGRVLFDALGVPRALYRGLPAPVRRIDWDALSGGMRPRPRDAHKGVFGRLLLVGGDAGFAGAIALAAEAAARTGAGLVRVATRQMHCPALGAACPEVMWQGVERPGVLGALLGWASAVVVGPGLGRSAWGQGLLARVLESDLPLVVDADALNLLAADPLRRDNWILTPHPGEAARLLGCSVAEVEADRFAALSELRSRFGGTVLLKGAGTLIDDEAGIALCSGGNPGMASGGMGDLLSGLIGGLLVQGFERPAVFGAALHAAAGDLAARGGERGMLARDLLPGIRGLINPEVADAAS